MANLKRFLLTAAAVVSCAAVLAAADDVQAAGKDESKIAEGVYIGSVDVGGMTEKEAQNAVDAYVESLDDLIFTLSGPNGSMAGRQSDQPL
jgi:predicted small secreted protein